MDTFSPTPWGPTRLSLSLVAGFFAASVLGCAQSATEEPARAPAPEEQESASEAGSDLETVQKRPQESVANLLQGRFAGVNVYQNPDGSITVRIRGASSFYASSDPLFVVDGTPVQPGPRGALWGINPHDIQSIKVLKHPPETTLYGVRGANGVVLITTKRPRG